MHSIHAVHEKAKATKFSSDLNTSAWIQSCTYSALVKTAEAARYSKVKTSCCAHVNSWLEKYRKFCKTLRPKPHYFVVDLYNKSKVVQEVDRLYNKSE